MHLIDWLLLVHLHLHKLVWVAGAHRAAGATNHAARAHLLVQRLVVVVVVVVILVSQRLHPANRVETGARQDQLADCSAPPPSPSGFIKLGGAR